MAIFKKLVETEKRKTFGWPEGWSTKEQVARELSCAIDQVQREMAPLIRAGSVEMQWFKVYRDGRMVRMQGYRPKQKKGGGK